MQHTRSITVGRTVVASVLAGAALLGASGTALAAASDPAKPGDVAVVDEPNTDNLHNKWTFAPLGVPVFGLIDAVQGVPGKLLPGGS